MIQTPDRPDIPRHPYDRADEDEDRPVDTIDHNGEYL